MRTHQPDQAVFRPVLVNGGESHNEFYGLRDKAGAGCRLRRSQSPGTP